MIIQAAEILTAPVGRNPAELLRQVQAFQHMRATGEVPPSGWQPGKKTLKPGPDLVGKSAKSGTRLTLNKAEHLLEAR